MEITVTYEKNDVLNEIQIMTIESPTKGQKVASHEYVP